MWNFDSHLDYSQHLPSRVSPLFFSFSYGIFPFRCMSDPFGCRYAVFIWYISLQVYEWPLWLSLCGQSLRWPLFVMVMVMRSTLRTIGSDTTDGFMYIYFFIYMGYGYTHSHWLWSLRDCGFIWLYDISLTHIRP